MVQPNTNSHLSALHMWTSSLPRLPSLTQAATLKSQSKLIQSLALHPAHLTGQSLVVV